MQALELLLNRHSQPRLVEPAPSGEVMDNIMQAALKAPDHASLSPWRFVVCEGEGLHKLGQVFQQAAQAAGKSERDIDRAPSLPLRAPMVVVCICEYTEHDKVPWIEQVCSTACAAHAMQMAALAQGFNGIWRTGSYAQDDTVKQALGLKDKDEIVGFLYLGSTVTKARGRPPYSNEDYFTHWS